MGKDKILHAGVCCAIAFIVAVLLALVADVWIAVTVGVVSSMLTGVGKEFGDKSAVGNHWCWADLLADFVGAVIGGGVAVVVVLLFSN